MVKKKLRPLLRSQNFKNSIWTFLSTITYPVFVVATTPFFISRLGPNQYGIWVLINTTTQLMSIFNLGLGDTAIKYISTYRALNEPAKIRQTVSAIWGVGLLVFILAIIIGILLALMFKRTDWFDISPGLRNVAAGSAFLGLMLFGLKFKEQIVFSVLQGFERYDMASQFSIASRLIALLANFIMAYYGHTLQEIFSSSIIVFVTFLAIEIFIVTRQFPIVSFRPVYTKRPLHGIFTFGLWSWTQSLLAIITTQTDKLIVAYFSGVQTLTYYSLGSLLTTQLHSLFTSVSAWVFPSVSRKYIEGDSLHYFFKKSETILLGFGFSSIVCLLLVEKPLLGFWLGEDTYQKSAVFIQIFICYNLFLLLNIIPHYFLNGAGYVRENTVSEFIAKALNILCMILFYKWLGTAGLIWGLVYSMLIATPVRMGMLYFYVLKRKSWVKGIESLLCPVVIMLAFRSDNFAYKAAFLLLFVLLFFIIYIKPLWRLRKTSSLFYVSK